jgi:hypothetical protein
VVGAIILALEVWVALEGILALRRDRQAALLTKQTSGAA